MQRTVPPTEAEAIALVRHALEAGCGIDTARVYVNAERRVGLAITGLPTGDDLPLVTKLSPLPGIAPDDRAAARAAARASIQESRAALGLDRLPTVLLHRAEQRTAWDGAVWRELLELVRHRTIGILGASVQTVEELTAALADPDIRHVQLPLNPLDARWFTPPAAAAIAARPDVTIHVRSIYLQGILLRDAAAWPKVVSPTPLLAWLDGWAKRLGRSRAGLCLAYVRATDWVHGVVVGAENRGQLDDNLHLFAEAPLTRPERAAMDADRPTVPDTLVNPALWPRT